MCTWWRLPLEHPSLSLMFPCWSPMWSWKHLDRWRYFSGSPFICLANSSFGPLSSKSNLGQESVVVYCLSLLHSKTTSIIVAGSRSTVVVKPSSISHSGICAGVAHYNVDETVFEGNVSEFVTCDITLLLINHENKNTPNKSKLRKKLKCQYNTLYVAICWYTFS